MSNTPILTPSGYATPVAVGYADPAENLILVTDDVPLPVSAKRAAAPAPLTGATSQTTVAGPFVPALDTPIHLELRGTWSGQVALQRSVDGGATRSGVTVGGMPWAAFSGNANEVVWQEGEEGASLYLDITLTSGTLTYRLAQ